MLRRLAARLAGPLVAALLVTLPPVPAAVAGDGLTAAEREEIGPLVRQYLLAHPEVIQEALEALDARQKAEAAKARADTIDSLKDAIYASKYQALLGNPKAPITLVEFVDYNCGYCKRALADTRALLDSQKDLKIVLKEFPILSQGSLAAAKVASAVNIVAPEKYEAFHFALLGSRGQADEARALEAAAKAGIDVAAVKKAMDDPSVIAGIQESYQLAQKLEITGTPTYVIGEEVISGAIGIGQLREKIESLRSCGKTSC